MKLEQREAAEVQRLWSLKIRDEQGCEGRILQDNELRSLGFVDKG